MSSAVVITVDVAVSESARSERGAAPACIDEEGDGLC